MSATATVGGGAGPVRDEARAILARLGVPLGALEGGLKTM